MGIEPAANGVWSGIIGNIPAGSNRTFHARAFDSSGTLLFEGSASGVTISAGQSSLVAITLQEVDAPPPFENEAPLMDSLVAFSTMVPVGASIPLQATAHDPNPEDLLSYAWTATAGTFQSPSASSTSWTAPSATGIQTLTVTVTDSHGLSSSISLAVNVIPAGGQGEAQLSISFNTSPRVAALDATPTRMDVGQMTAVAASASDPDGDGLSYAWSATCAGSWNNASSSSAQFTPSVLPAGACNNCNLTVTVSDGRGGQTTGTVALCVSPPRTPNHFSPVILRSYRSSDTATAGQVLTYEVEASDPEGSALTFSWAASTGSLGTASNDASSSRNTWMAPSCLSNGTPPTITVTVTNAFHLTAMKSFSVAGLPSCSGWASTGSMAVARARHVATRLPDGKVLVSGGRDNSGVLATAEVYDPASSTWSTTGSMATVRWRHSATLLPDGKVLVSGGSDDSGSLATAEVYDPASGTWSMTGALASRRSHHTATLLPDGKVLVAGAVDSSRFLVTAEVYDPASGTWSPTGQMGTSRIHHTATLLLDGKVLVSGGYSFSAGGDLATAEVYDPTSGTWSPASAMASARQGHTATRLPNGKVLVSGGYNNSKGHLATAEVYDPASGTWSPVGSTALARYSYPATPLSDGRVLITGGSNNIRSYVEAEVYDPVSGTWSPVRSMRSPRSEHTATLLPDGRVLVSGGNGSSGALSSAEVYTP